MNVARAGIAVWVLASLVGCVGAGGYEARMRGTRGELMYLRTAAATERVPGTVRVAAVAVDASLPPETTVKRTGGWVVPLLFVNVWKGEYRSELGAAQIANDLGAFVRESLVEDLRRGARYALAEGDADVQLDVRVTRVEMNAPILETGNALVLLLFFSMTSTTTAGPVDVRIEGEAVARRGGVEVLRKPITGRSRSGVLHWGRQMKIEDYTTAMIEAVSLAVKSFNDGVVAEVNRL
jgi:hypothetical protein